MFITVEGIEGAGKSSQVRTVVSFLQSRELPCTKTREPGGTRIGTRIREILLDPANTNMDPWAELMLYLADRVQHLKEVIYPELAAGRVVVCDRFFDATLVYQGYARGLDLETIRTLHHLVCQDIQPDLTLLLDLTPQQGLARAWDRIRREDRDDPDSRFEQEELEFHNRVRQGYLELARLAPHRFRVIDAAQNEGRVSQHIEKTLEDFFPLPAQT